MMLETLRDILDPVLGESWERLTRASSSEAVAPGTRVRQAGEPVTEVLVVECGLFEVAAPGQPAQWATTGAVIGLAASLSGADSPVSVTALHHGRLTRVPAAALFALGDDERASTVAIARLAQRPDHGLASLPPDPLIVTVLLEGCDDATEARITADLELAVRALDGGRMARMPVVEPTELATELAALETNATTIVYLVSGRHGERAADMVAHADRVVVCQPDGSEAATSKAFAVACDGAAGRHTELVYVGGEQEANTRATRKMRSLPMVERVHVMPDSSATRLQLLLTDLRHNAREHESLREFEVFADLSAPELAWIQNTLRWERVDGGSMLLRQGDSADSAWLIRAGRLQVVRKSTAGERHVAWLGPGAFVAEPGLLTGEKRRTSLRAVRDSTVARLDRHIIDALLERSPAFTRAVATVIAPRASSASASAMRRARTFTLVPLVSEGRAGAFAALLADVCEEAGFDATIVDAARLNAALGAHASSTRRGDVGDAEIIAWLDRLEQDHDAVILVCGADVDSWTRRAVRQSDHILLVADATTTPELRPIERDLPEVLGARHLVLLQPKGISEARGTNAWLAPRPQHAHHHVRTDDRGDVARLARRLTGRAVALALSGASSRAPAHFGVVRAMEEYGLPIDIASGSSSGAGVAALVSTGLRAEDGLAKAIQIITRGAPHLSQFQFPITALTSGAAADRSLQEVFGDKQLEDQLIPAVLMAVDIRRHRAVHLTRGPIWKMVRASGALPLLWPPVWHEGDLLVDGGIINYLPIEVFGEQADDGLIIASNLDETAGLGAPAFEGALDYGTVLNSWKELGRRIMRSQSARPPALTDILFHTMGIPSFQQQEGLAALAERDNVCILTPTLGNFGLFEVTPEVGRSLEKASFDHARLALNRVASLWHSRLEWRAVSTPAN